MIWSIECPANELYRGYVDKQTQGYPGLVHLWRHVYLSTDAPITNLFYAILLSNSLVSRRLGYFSAGYWTFGFAIPVPDQNVQKWDY